MLLICLRKIKEEKFLLFRILLRPSVCTFLYLFYLSIGRETLLGQQIMYIRHVNEDFNSRTGRGNKSIPKGMNNPEIVNNIIYVRQLEAKVTMKLTAQGK